MAKRMLSSVPVCVRGREREGRGGGERDGRVEKKCVCVRERDEGYRWRDKTRGIERDEGEERER